jgi:hypothetical protein
MDAKTLTINILDDISNKKVNIDTAMDIIILVMELVEPLIFAGPEKLDYALFIIDLIIKDGRGTIPDELLDALKYLYENNMIPHIICALCKAFKQQINLLKKRCITCFNKCHKVKK